MLQRIHIQNYALIKELNLQLKPGFTAITGETGSGKSILLGALGLVLGERADTHVLFDKNVKCIVEVELNLEKADLEQLFKSFDLDYAHLSSFRREINTSGRSRAFINDTPVPLTTIKRITDELIDIHSQHQTLLLRDVSFQLELLDLFAEHGTGLTDYQETFHDYRSAQEELRKLKQDIQTKGIDKDYLLFQLNELSESELSPGQDDSLREELGLMEHAEEIKSVLAESNVRLSTEQGIMDRIHDLSTGIDRISGHTKGLEELSSRLNSVRLELEDISQSISETEANIEFDQERQQILSEQLDVLQHLLSKHRCSSVESLIELKAEIEERLVMADTAESRVKDLEKKVRTIYGKLETAAKDLSSNRKKAIPRFVKEVSKSFKNLSLENAKVNVNISHSTDFHMFGADDINILFNANKGGALEELHKVASGGELSRLMLILKKQMAASKGLPTLIFDEIDTGVSGEIASQMAGVLREMSGDRQVISITHLPQVAARANHHLRISKSDTDERSITDVEWLDDDGRIIELAKMLSGTQVSEASVANARDLLKN